MRHLVLLLSVCVIGRIPVLAQWTIGLPLSVSATQLTGTQKASILGSSETFGSTKPALSYKNIGLFAEVPVSSGLDIHVELLYSATTAETSPNDIGPLPSLIQLPNGTDTVIVTQVGHAISTSSKQISFLGMADADLGSGYGLNVGVGVQYFLLAHQSQKLLSDRPITPDSSIIFYVDYPYSLVLTENDIAASKHIFINVVVGIEKDFEVGDSWLLSPFVRLEYGTKLLSEVARYNMETLRGGLALKFKFL